MGTEGSEQHCGGGQRVGRDTCEHAGGQQVPATKDGDSADKRQALGPLLALLVPGKA